MRQKTNASSYRRRFAKIRRIWANTPMLSGSARLPLKQSGVHLVTLVLGLLTISLLINFVNQVMQSAHLETHRAELEAEVAFLQEDIQRLQAGVEYAESDVHVERIAREQLGYAREGDVVVLPQYPATTPTPTPDQEQAAAPEARPTSAAPNWQRWWHTFTTDDPLSVRENGP